MIWCALRVTPNREFTTERILRLRFRRMPIEFGVPLRYRVFKVGAKREVRPRPILPGLVLVGASSVAEVPIAELIRIGLVHGVLTGGDGNPMVFGESDMIRILGDLHQRPKHYQKPPGRSRPPGEGMEIASGPYEGRIARVVSEEKDHSLVDYMALTGTTKSFDDLKFDNDDNQGYTPAPDAPLAVAGQADQSSKGGPGEIERRHRGQCVSKPIPRYFGP